jgi:ATP-dependent RNA helicase DeaD
MSTDIITFAELALKDEINQALVSLGYEAPTPVQQQSIPILLAGGDLLGQAQTGTGKTAAFALPILSKIDLKLKKPQALIIAPTRELAIQVAEAFQSYAKYLPGFHVAPIYGGQDSRIQVRALTRGPHVVVGTPGRLMDHLRRKRLDVSAVKTVVLDEADEMLKMGFIDDITWILDQIDQPHQTALFSATMPAVIQKVSQRYLKDAKKVQIKTKTNRVETIQQLYMCVERGQKVDALTRYLEVEEMEAVIVFVRTKTASAELAQKIQARGYAAEALNGDIKQQMREKVIGRLKDGKLDIVVATDVAARGLDVSRLSHVINFDIPSDIEAYTHRIGRTGRAGREGKALLFITPRELRLLKDIERAMPNAIKQIDPPSLQEMTEKRSQALSEKITNIITKSKKLTSYQAMVDDIEKNSGCEARDIAAAFAYMLQQANPLPAHELTSAEKDNSGASSKRRRPQRRGQSSNDRDSRPRSRKSNSERDSHPRSRKSNSERDSQPRSRKPSDKKDDRKPAGATKQKSSSRSNQSSDNGSSKLDKSRRDLGDIWGSDNKSKGKKTTDKKTKLKLKKRKPK